MVAAVSRPELQGKGCVSWSGDGKRTPGSLVVDLFGDGRAEWGPHGSLWPLLLCPSSGGHLGHDPRVPGVGPGGCAELVVLSCLQGGRTVRVRGGNLLEEVQGVCSNYQGDNQLLVANCTKELRPAHGGKGRQAGG